MVYDTLPVGISLGSTFELYAICTGLINAPLCVLAAFLYGEIPDGFTNIIEFNVEGNFGDSTNYVSLILIAVAAFVLLVKPFIIHIFSYSFNASTYYGTNLFLFIAYAALSTIFLQLSVITPSLHSVAYIITVGGGFYFYKSIYD